MDTDQRFSLSLFLERKTRSMPLFRVNQLKVFTKPTTWNTPQMSDTDNILHVALDGYNQSVTFGDILHKNWSQLPAEISTLIKGN